MFFPLPFHSFSLTLPREKDLSHITVSCIAAHRKLHPLPYCGATHSSRPRPSSHRLPHAILPRLGASNAAVVSFRVRSTRNPIRHKRPLSSVTNLRSPLQNLQPPIRHCGFAIRNPLFRQHGIMSYR